MPEILYNYSRLLSAKILPTWLQRLSIKSKFPENEYQKQ